MLKDNVRAIVAGGNEYHKANVSSVLHAFSGHGLFQASGATFDISGLVEDTISCSLGITNPPKMANLRCAASLNRGNFCATE